MRQGNAKIFYLRACFSMKDRVQGYWGEVVYVRAINSLSLLMSKEQNISSTLQDFGDQAKEIS